MKRLRFQALATLLAAFISAAGGMIDAGATSLVALDLAELIADAEHVAHVRCIGNEVRPDATVGAVTVTTFVVLDRAKGADGPTLIVRQAGGVLGALAIDYRVPKFRSGDEYVLFVPPASILGLASPVGLMQGVFGVTADAAGKTVGDGRDFGALLAGVERASMPPGVAAQLQEAPGQRQRVALADFMALVRARLGPR